MTVRNKKVTVRNQDVTVATVRDIIVEFESGRYKEDEHFVRKTEDLKKDVCAATGSGKISAHAGERRSEMQAREALTRRTPRASQIRSDLRHLERSPKLGTVMKKGRGTPTKMQRFTSLKNKFENSPSSQKLGLVGLRQWEINFNPTTTTRGTRLNLDNCADQWERWSQTRSRQPEVGSGEQASDWTIQACAEPAAPTRDALMEDVIGKKKSEN